MRFGAALWQELVAGLPDNTEMARIVVRLLFAVILGGILGFQRAEAGKADIHGHPWSYQPTDTGSQRYFLSAATRPHALQMNFGFLTRGFSALMSRWHGQQVIAHIFSQQ